jgi:hypothetical protein
VHGACPKPAYGDLAAQVLAQLSEKYDRMVNLAEFLQIYSTPILALTGTARSWLMNLP